VRIAILESIIMPAGHEVEFDRILVEELKKQGHEPIFFVPQKYPFKLDYHVPVTYLEGGEAISYAGAGCIKKLWLSLLREKRRKQWFDSACEKVLLKSVEAIIVPTATYRYLRTLLRSRLKDSSVPIYFIFHGINPLEQLRFEKQARQCLPYKNLHLRIITLRNDLAKNGLNNVVLIPPPVFKPLDFPVNRSLDFAKSERPLKIGFFGQFRKEKKLGFFLQAFIRARFSLPVQLIVQGSTTKREDAELFERYAVDYSGHKNIIFWHANLIGTEWQKALLDVDVIAIPYSAERYRYHWSAMLFTAIGFYKPVICSPELNPEVLQKYKVGIVAETKNVSEFAAQLESFINDLTCNTSSYRLALDAANREYGHSALVKNILQEK